MPTPIKGIHHITAVSGPPEENVRFYNADLGLRFTKKTVNFDDPFTYHLYYGNEGAEPGSSITFFPWQHVVQGAPSVGEATEVSYSVPSDSLDAWNERLQERGLKPGKVEQRFGLSELTLKDRDGMTIRLIEDPEAESMQTKGYGGLADDIAIRGFFSARLSLSHIGPTAELMEEFGWKRSAEESGLVRYESAPENRLGRFVDLVEEPSLQGRFGRGSIHHIAFRVESEEVQQEWREHLLKAGLDVSPVRDRVYFRSIYFREPGGILFELATDGPGFTVDEPMEDLGRELRLPPWYESHREQIESKLPNLNIDRSDS
ncbi:MAG: ring-cleaving dioxygenase [Balneolaceae bacterium]